MKEGRDRHRCKTHWLWCQTYSQMGGSTKLNFSFVRNTAKASALSEAQKTICDCFPIGRQHFPNQLKREKPEFSVKKYSLLSINPLKVKIWMCPFNLIHAFEFLHLYFSFFLLMLLCLVHHLRSGNLFEPKRRKKSVWLRSERNKYLRDARKVCTVKKNIKD